MTRDEMRTYMRTLLGVEDNDQLFTDARLDLLLEHAHAGLVGEMRKVAPDYFVKTSTITYSGTANQYNLGAQIPDFAEVLSVRVTDATGAKLSPTGIEQIGSAGSNKYALYDRDDIAKIITSGDVTGAVSLWVRYSYWPTALTSNIAPPGVPEKYHEVVPLEAVFAFEIGNEQQVPKVLRERWELRKRQLLAHISNRVLVPTAVGAIVNRGDLRSLMRTWLGVREDDRYYTDDRLNQLLQSAHASLLSDIDDVNPSYFTVSQTLTAEGATGDDAHRYVFANQTPAISNFSKWEDVRDNDQEGVKFTQVRLSELYDAGAYTFTLQVDATDGLLLRTSPHAEDAVPLFMQYSYWPTAMAADADTPAGIPAEYVDVVALEAVFSLPGVAERTSPLLGQRWVDRRGQMLFRIGRLGATPSRVRQVEDRELDFTA